MRRWLPKIASGTAIGTLALAEEPATSLPAKSEAWSRAASCKARRCSRPTARSRTLRSSRRASTTPTSGSSSSISPIEAFRARGWIVDPSRNHAEIVFDNAVADPLGAVDEGWALLMRRLDRAAVLLAFEQVGGADRALEMAKDYALERYAFGRPIGSYQAIKHKLADMYVKNELARSNAYYGAWALDAGAAELPRRPPRRGSRPPRPSGTAPRRTCRPTAASASPGSMDCHLLLPPRATARRGARLAASGKSAWSSAIVDATRPDGRTDHGFQRHAPKKPPTAPRRAPGWRPTRRRSDAIAAAEARANRRSARWASSAPKAWQQRKAAAGYACITWPKEWGGGGATPMERVIFGQEEGALRRASDLPDRPRHVRADDDGLRATSRSSASCRPGRPARRSGASCSPSPPAGSDVAGRAPAPNARRPATGSSTARRSGPPARTFRDFGILITRTDPDVPKHKGLTMFWLDMRSARRRGAADPPGERPVGLQRGLFHRRARPGQPAPRRGRRRLARLAGDADERAPLDRRRLATGAPEYVRTRLQRAARRRDAGINDAAVRSRSSPTGRRAPRA